MNPANDDLDLFPADFSLQSEYGPGPAGGYTRLERAFAALERSGVVIRQDFTCCSSCGFSEIGAEMEEAAELGRRVRGFAFFHQQDTERLLDSGSLLLAFGNRDDLSTAEEIGWAVVGALLAEGLKVQWSGEASERIRVELEEQVLGTRDLGLD